MRIRYKRVPLSGTFPRDPALIPLLGMDAVVVWLVVSRAVSGHGWDPVSLLFFTVLAVVPLALVIATGVWVSERHILIQMGPIRRIYRFDQIAGITHAKSFWTNGMRVLSIVAASGEVVPIPGWMLRSEVGDQETVRRLEMAIGADSSLPVLLGRV